MEIQEDAVLLHTEGVFVTQLSGNAGTQFDELCGFR